MVANSQPNVQLITMKFCELVDSTSLASKLDGEDRRNLVKPTSTPLRLR
jgi:hypothetical protein